MLNRFALVELYHNNPGEFIVHIQRYGRDWIGFNYSSKEINGKRSVTKSSLQRLKRITREMLLTRETIDKCDQTIFQRCWQWQPPTLILIPYQCPYCYEIIWSTNPDLYIECGKYNCSNTRMVKKK